MSTTALESAAGILPEAFGKEVLGLPAELYLKGDVLILQFRARIRQGYSKDLISEVKQLN